MRPQGPKTLASRHPRAQSYSAHICDKICHISERNLPSRHHACVWRRKCVEQRWCRPLCLSPPPPPLPLLLDGPLLAFLECLAPCADFIPARMLRRTHTPPKCDCDSDAAMIPLVRGEAKLSGVLLNGCARKPEVRGTRLSGFSSGFSFRVYTGVMQGVHRGGMKVAGRKYEAPACQGLVQGLGRVKIGARMKVAGSKYETLALTKSSEPGTPTPNSCHSCSENAVLRCSSCASFKFSISRP